MVTWPGVRDCRVIGKNEGLDVEFDPLLLAPDELLTVAEAAMRVVSGRCGASDRSSPGTGSHAGSQAHTSSSRPVELLMAGGSLMIAVAGLVVPGIPSLPFLLVACDKLSQVYPQLKPWLLSLPGLGRRLGESATTGGRLVDPNLLRKTFVLGCLMAAFFLVVHPPLPVVAACELGMLFCGS
jgi:uncharacterized membrane protein YbaN (DUF454 family)